DLERAANIPRERREETREPVVVALEPRRRLEEDRPEAIAQRPGPVEEDGQRLRRIGQLPEVRDRLRRLQREKELRRGGGAPSGDVLLRREVVEGVVHFERRESCRVIPEEVRGLHLRRVEDRLPGCVRPAGGPDEGVPVRN